MNPKHFCRYVRPCLAAGALTLCTACQALTFPYNPQNALLGAIYQVSAPARASLGDVGREYDIGMTEMMEANPHVRDEWSLNGDEKLTIPSEFLLPKGYQKGIVINLAEFRLYYFHDDGHNVSTFPIGIGKEGWSTPVADAKVIRKKENPDWHVPPSIWESHAKKGKILPHVIPAGPDNPLGDYAMYLSVAGYLIHGTNVPAGVGVRSSHGCIRMMPNDIDMLFQLVDLNTPVQIIHEPLKVAYVNGDLYLEVHRPLAEPMYSNSATMEAFMKLLARENINMPINWGAVEKMVKEARGIPGKISL